MRKECVEQILDGLGSRMVGVNITSAGFLLLKMASMCPNAIDLVKATSLGIIEQLNSSFACCSHFFLPRGTANFFKKGENFTYFSIFVFHTVSGAQYRYHKYLSSDTKFHISFCCKKESDLVNTVFEFEIFSCDIDFKGRNLNATCSCDYLQVPHHIHI